MIHNVSISNNSYVLEVACICIFCRILGGNRL